MNIHVNDADFDHCLAEFVDVTARVINDAAAFEEFAPTVALHFKDDVEINVLTCDDACDDSDLYEMLFRFGQHLGVSGSVPCACFVAAQFRWIDHSLCIFVSGATPDGRRNGAKMTLRGSAAPESSLVESEFFPVEDGIVFEGRTGASELMRGFHESGTLG